VIVMVERQSKVLRQERLSTSITKNQRRGDAKLLAC